MDLLKESKRAWLLSYVLFSFLAFFSYYFFWHTDIGRMFCVLITEMLLLMFMFFILITIFKWKKLCRTILIILFIIGNIYLGANHIIYKWYIIVPLSVFLLFYMLWNIGGIVNCIIISKYRSQFKKILSEYEEIYEEYKSDVTQYNLRNDLGILAKGKIRRKLHWTEYEFHLSGLDMFSPENAFWGISTRDLEQKLYKFKKEISLLEDKCSAVESDESLHEEKNKIDRIGEKLKSLGHNTKELEKAKKRINIIIKENRKQIKKVLKKGDR